MNLKSRIDRLENPGKEKSTQLVWLDRNLTVDEQAEYLDAYRAENDIPDNVGLRTIGWETDSGVSPGEQTGTNPPNW
ncbi:hypothetical protein M3P21_21100 [Ruegeria sp. 2012CJ41-6]|uniref:Uncharacterized protein n=1 Tax=Ruegeria spongiae TaxID=2942209 RepID=A0ABT0Q8W4_9RHOB|nr:hypothetical protein [Ruegeria spongiae]MCL6286017.1 hypothetical protein [Ruegeria spongiae]